jgi:hypothetical protein
MSVRAKFRCLEIRHQFSSSPDHSAATVVLSPVWEQDGVNREWSKATPSGNLEMMITAPEAVNRFELGKCYFVDFTPAE